MQIWEKFLAPIPPRHHHSIFAMLARVPEFTVRGDQFTFLQFSHVVRRVLEIGKWLSLGHNTPVPQHCIRHSVSPHPHLQSADTMSPSVST